MGESDRPAWTPDASDGRPTCTRCGAHVSHSFHRLWRDADGVLRWCRECVPRSIRFANADPGDVEDFDPDRSNAGKPAGGQRRE